MAALFTCNSAKASIRPKSNLSMILCLNKLSASLKKIWSKSKSLCPDSIFPIICLWETKGQVTHMQVIPTAPKSKLSNTYLEVWWTFDQKWNKIAIVLTTFSKVYGALKGRLLLCHGQCKLDQSPTCLRFNACFCFFCELDEDSINKRAIMTLYHSSENHSTKGTWPWNDQCKHSDQQSEQYIKN